jgi:hypothetical protein
MAAMYNATYPCKNKTHTACSKNVAKQLGMRIIETIDDGDCFFDTLATYGWAYHYEPLEHPHQQLRQILVDDMESHMEEVAPYIVVNENEGETVESMIDSLREDMVWNNDMGDLLSQIAARAFHVNIFIYDVDPPEIRRIRANQSHYPGPPIHMLRINNGHYQLLLPQEDAHHVIGSYASAHKKSKSKKSNTAKKGNNFNNGNSVHKLSHALSKAAISNHHTHKNHGNHGNHQLLKNRQDLHRYDKITVARLHRVLRSFGISEEDIQMSILSLPKKEQKTAYYDRYVSLLS